MVYSVLKGALRAAKPFGQNPRRRPHYHLLIEAGGVEYDVAINIASEDPRVDDVRVLYAIKDAGSLRNLAAIRAFSGTIADLDDAARKTLGLDFVAEGIVSRDEMSLLPGFDGGVQNDIVDFVDRAVRNANAEVYAFGHRYTDARPVNDAWRFSPDAGVHNIHMNQGNAPGNHDDENGRYNDGALLIHFTDSDRWEIGCIAFQTQSWDNGEDGYPR